MPIAENSNSGADWTALDAFKYRDERETIAGLLADPPLSPSERPPVERAAIALVKATRENARRQGVVQSFLQEFSLTTPEAWH
jgi:RHH-type proline utilization regulon transcriptional repressor/proline dehydrogenase/delta 1-pyrroline-5-carboxylate dehydrogenase